MAVVTKIDKNGTKYWYEHRCPKCGQWYNLFGQELIDPEYWEE